ncbi:hypothetical protein [Streptomyces hirsutus]|uniref:hypothetical protein n=1 Tax=Streptomyces hirsutus TaxID=35620 RepID=UPI0033DC7AF2
MPYETSGGPARPALTDSGRAKREAPERGAGLLLDTARTMLVAAGEAEERRALRISRSTASGSSMVA